MDTQTYQYLLLQMRNEYLQQLPERCDLLDSLILTLEKMPDDRDAFNELFRGVHSLKGSGGTLGVGVVTTICHQFETLLSETDARRDFGENFATRALAYVDLLRRIVALAQQENQNYAPIESELEKLRLATLQNRKTGLIAESSSTMAGFYQHALQGLPLQLVVESNGLAALGRLLHESFDFVITGREIDGLSGVALMSALRANHARNKDVAAILVTSRNEKIPESAEFNAVITRDQHLAANLLAAVQKLLLPEAA
jgi:chemotaxis protein histidine kinase CheA